MVSALLTSLNILTPDQLHIAFIEQKRSSRPLEQILIELGFITEKTLFSVLAQHQGLERVDLSHTIPDAQLIQRVPAEVAREYQMLPLILQGDTLTVAIAESHNIMALDQIRLYIQEALNILPALTSASSLKEAIDIYYGSPFCIDKLFEAFEQEALEESGKRATEVLPGESPAVLLVNALIDDAVKQRASDIHFHPEDSFVRLRYRIDGVLLPIKIFHKSLWPLLCGRLKVMAKMNITESRRPQNGRFHLRIGSRSIDFRASIHPTVQGESLVIRILDQGRGILEIDNLGFTLEDRDHIRSILQKPQGLIIVTGPTGSGKTTTLYALLAYLRSAHLNIMTLEDPVEYQLPLLRQTEIHEASGLTFSEGIRSALRQDLDVLLVGEIRDEETAQMALRAAMTGHRVFTTLHTSDAYGALARLEDLGLSRKQLAGVLSGIIAQRLVRELCRACQVAYEPTVRQKLLCSLPPQGLLLKAKGCEACHYTGYQGRRAVAEVLVFDRALEEALLQEVPMQTLLSQARERGFRSLWDQALTLVQQGVTSFEEIHRALEPDG